MQGSTKLLWGLLLVAACGMVLGLVWGEGSPMNLRASEKPPNKESTSETSSIPLVPILPPPLYDKGEPPPPDPPQPTPPNPTRSTSQASPTVSPSSNLPGSILRLFSGATSSPSPTPKARPTVPSASPPAPTPPTRKSSPGSSPVSAEQGEPSQTSTVEELLQRANRQYAGIQSYIARAHRRERKGKDWEPSELILFKFRKHPWSVHCKWISKAGYGREVIYVKGKYGNKLHTILAAGDHPFMARGARLSLALNSFLVRTATRHPITEAGIGASLRRLNTVFEELQRGSRRLGTLKALAKLDRPEFPKPVPGIEHTIPPGVEKTLPRGGKRLYCFAPDSHLPVLLTTRDQSGLATEYYFYDRLLYPVHLDDADFDPERQWPRKKDEE